MSSSQSVSEEWAKIVQFYEETHPAHRQAPMMALVTAVAEAGVRNAVWPLHSHFDLKVFAEDVTRIYSGKTVFVSAVYWHEVDKFKLSYFNIQGIPHDEKWCELVEAQATLRYLFRQMRQGELREF